MKGQEEVGRAQPLSRVIHPPPPATKVRYDGNARRSSPSTGNKGAANQEGEFPCKKCGRSVVRNIPSVTAALFRDVCSALFSTAAAAFHGSGGLELTQF